VNFSVVIYVKGGKKVSEATWEDLDRFVIAPDPDGWFSAGRVINQLRFELKVFLFRKKSNALDAGD